MKILVCISKTPDTTAKIAFTDNNRKFVNEGVQWILNPYDEWYALVRAIELKEKDSSIVLHLITVGGPDCDPVIRKALALGGDEAIRINTEPGDSFYVANQIASVGGMLATLLDLPFISLAAKLELDGDKATLIREIEGGEETVEVKLPLVVGCQKGMAEQRIPNMKGIMGARSKPLKVVEPVASDPLTEILSFELPAAKKGVRLVPADKPEELIRLLHEEAKVI